MELKARKWLLLVLGFISTIPSVSAQYYNEYGFSAIDSVINVIASVGYSTALQSRVAQMGLYRLMIFIIVFAVLQQASEKIGLEKKTGTIIAFCFSFIGAFAADPMLIFVGGSIVKNVVMYGFLLFVIFAPLVLLWRIKKHLGHAAGGIAVFIICIIFIVFLMQLMGMVSVSRGITPPPESSSAFIIGLDYLILKFMNRRSA